MPTPPNTPAYEPGAPGLRVAVLGLGLGAMGLPMARRLAAAPPRPLPVSVFDVDPARRAPAADGATEAEQLYLLRERADLRRLQITDADVARSGDQFEGPL